MMMTLDERRRLNFAADSLAGLSVGDALGAQHFLVGGVRRALYAEPR
jgi:hypothetical protein